MRRMILLSFFVNSFLFSCQNEKGTPISALPITGTQIPEFILLPTKISYPVDFDTLKWVELDRLMPDVFFDLKYATTDNFVEEQMYECPRAFLRPKAANALLQVQEELKKQGFNLKILDAYRPRPVQQRLWNKVPDHRYVAPPEKGSMHNRGAAVDLTLVDAEGNELDMGTAYDYFGKEAWPEYQNLPEEVLKNRLILRRMMLKYDFNPTRSEWWHYSMNGTGFGLSDWEWECKL
ncbi:MAG: D-alanyl-D-alanine dipeptidase [Saprospiraceae bacterium]|jgi:D-alanyl-D-alanine dipeptidase